MYKHKWPHITDHTKRAVLAQLDNEEVSIYNRSGIFELFENNFIHYLGIKYGLVVSSGTAGLHTAMVACNFQPGDEVICPAYTFYASVSPIFQTGAVPVLCEAQTDGNIDANKIESLITTRTKAVIVTHMWGIPCEMDTIVSICKKYNLKLIEDCSHGHGAKYKGKFLGTFGDVSVFSLQGQKIITGGEGGIVVTNNKEIYDRSLLFGQYNKRCLQEIDRNSKYYEYAVTGFGLKLRAHPFAIAMANEQFSHLDDWHKVKVDNAAYLSSKLENVSGIILPQIINEGDEPGWYAYTILIDSTRLSISTKEFCNKLIDAGLLDADMPGSTCPLNLLKLFQEPGYLFPYYADKVGYHSGDFPVAEHFFNNAIKFPIDIYDTSDYKQVLDSYADILNKTLDKYRTK
ncbi:MAG: DegT/DnrJ/EryC1/StrS family aminotransferase [bacterium]|nr:DegT/DnrJ/EryC1/StrS family aminotransferase [bacterium]